MQTIRFMLYKRSAPLQIDKVEEQYCNLIRDLNLFFALNEQSVPMLVLFDLQKERILRSHRSIRKHLIELRERSPTFYGCTAGVTYLDDKEDGIQSHQLLLQNDERKETKRGDGPTVSMTFVAHTPTFDRSKAHLDGVFVEQAQRLGATSGLYFAVRQQWARSPATDPTDKVWCLADGLILKTSLVERIGGTRLRALATHWADYLVEDDKIVACVLDWLEKGPEIRELLEQHMGPERTDLTPVEDKNATRVQ